MLQSPQENQQRRVQTWRAMEDAKAAGMARAIGVANFTRRHLKELLNNCREAPAVLQLEMHPYFQQPEMIELCRSKGLQPMAFSPLAHGELRLLENRVLVDIAKAQGKTPAQVVLRWLLQQDIPPVVFSASPERLRENYTAGSFELSGNEMERITLLDRGREARVGFDPNFIA
eukprot:TRINITY_DN24938_c0_g1_i1.p2 TRINITY_DN24938_c0_g1~~TRINITY_DN24938_c0_g1_i1.p2  ORF type:complete len:173 (-),score=40.27 TRINITY_DN24938_c0_g1_i1:43-561(-)